jgi:hypothetical protein
MDLMELTSLESGSKTVDAATVDIHVAFIPSPANLVEVTKRQPLRPRRGLVGNKQHYRHVEMDMYRKHFCFEFFYIFKYIKNAFQIKGAYAPESKKASPR